MMGRWVKYIGFCFLILVLLGVKREVKLSTVVARPPIAGLLYLDDGQTGTLYRGGDTYTISKSGVGFKAGDKFVNGDGVAIIFLNNKATSFVRLGPKAEIVFWDANSYSVTGVYVASSDTSDIFFDIKHASPETPFQIVTPDLVLGVRGTQIGMRIDSNGTIIRYFVEVIGSFGTSTEGAHDVSVKFFNRRFCDPIPEEVEQHISDQSVYYPSRYLQDRAQEFGLRLENGEFFVSDVPFSYFAETGEFDSADVPMDIGALEDEWKKVRLNYAYWLNAKRSRYAPFGTVDTGSSGGNRGSGGCSN